MDCPEQINSAAWQEWIDYRKQRRKPVSPRAARLQWELLACLSHEQQRACIEQSIRNDWQGLFPPKVNAARRSTLVEDLTDRSWANK